MKINKREDKHNKFIFTMLSIMITNVYDCVYFYFQMNAVENEPKKTHLRRAASVLFDYDAFDDIVGMPNNSPCNQSFEAISPTIQNEQINSTQSTPHYHQGTQQYHQEQRQVHHQVQQVQQQQQQQQTKQEQFFSKNNWHHFQPLHHYEYQQARLDRTKTNDFLNTTITALKELERLQAINEFSVHTYRCHCCYLFFPITKASAPQQVINEFLREIDTRHRRQRTHDIRCSCCWLKFAQ